MGETPRRGSGGAGVAGVERTRSRPATTGAERRDGAQPPTGSGRVPRGPSTPAAPAPPDPLPGEERAMDELKVVRLDETEVVKFGPDAVYQLILGDDEGTTPIRTGIQTSQPGYVETVHSHPYMELLHILDGVAEAWVDGHEDRKVALRKGDTIAIPPELPHSFRVVGDEVLRLLGTHASPRRIVNYRDGVKSDARGYGVLEP